MIKSEWSRQTYKKWAANGYPEDDDVSILELYESALESIPREISRLPKLTSLSLMHNNLTTLPSEIGSLTHLKILTLSYNKLVSLPSTIGNLINLTALSLNSNNLSSLPVEIGLLSNLVGLWADYNKIESIPDEFGNLSSLTTLSLHDNRIQVIPPSLGNLRNLHTFWASKNRLSSIPPEIGQLRNLTKFFMGNNPIEFVPRNVTRLLERQYHRQGVYNDPQSVHNSTIQKTLKDSIMNLLRERIALDVVPAISTDLVLTETTKRSLAEYCTDTSVHTELNLTFADLLTIVWDRVSKSVHSAEIKRVLNTEMNDAVGMCFTGRISRLVNCLNGFDPLVNIRISDSEQIGNVVAVVRTTLEERGEYTSEKHREIARDRLQELGISKDEIERWLSHIE